jgi:hypothetical protein
LQSAANLLLESGVPRVDEIIYGDVYLVGDIERKKKVMAWYFQDSDTIQLIVVPRFDDKLVQVLIHEFGHRYWQKILGHDAKRAWARHHYEVEKSATRDIPEPQPGQALGEYIVKGLEKKPPHGLVVALTDPKHPERALTMKYTSYLKLERDSAVRRAYPTPYAATNEQEHFCEAIALFSMGDLKEPHRSAFERIFDVRVSTPAPAPAPAPPGKKGQIAMFNPGSRASRAARRIGSL